MSAKPAKHDLNHAYQADWAKYIWKPEHKVTSQNQDEVNIECMK